MKNLIQIIKSIPKNRVALITNNKKISYENIINFYEKNYINIMFLKKSSVVIKKQNNLDFAILIILLDSIVNNILFVPNDINDDILDDYYSQLDINYEVYIQNNKIKFTIINSKVNEKKFTNTNWIIPTSGTSRNPKLIYHTLESLSKSTNCKIQIEQKYIWGLCFDIYRFSGLQVFLQSIFSGSLLLIAEKNMSMNEKIHFFSKYNCNIMSATPSFFRQALMSEYINDLKLKSITLGGEIVNQQIINILNDTFKDASIRHIYALTEIGVVFSIDDKHEGFPKELLNNKNKNIRFNISTNNTLCVKNENEYFDTQDIVFEKNNRIYFLGRLTGSINVGGNKVQPEEVEKVLLENTLVQSTYVYAKASNIIGNLICAEVVIFDKQLDILLVKKNIIEHCKKNLEKYKVPAIIKIVNSIKITQNGKIKR